MTTRLVDDTFLTVQARYALYVIIIVGAALLVAGTAYQAYALDRQMAVQARV